MKHFKSNEINLVLFALVACYFIEKRFNSGFATFLFVFTLSNYFLLYPVENNSLIFYLILNTMNALLILQRSKYMETSLSKDFIESCKARLISRREELVREIEDLDHREPRDMGDSDYVDEVMEDLQIEKFVKDRFESAEKDGNKIYKALHMSQKDAANYLIKEKVTGYIFLCTPEKLMLIEAAKMDDGKGEYKAKLKIETEPENKKEANEIRNNSVISFEETVIVRGIEIRTTFRIDAKENGILNFGKKPFSNANGTCTKK